MAADQSQSQFLGGAGWQWKGREAVPAASTFWNYRRQVSTWRSDHGLSEAGISEGGGELNNGADVEKVKSTERYKSLPQIQHHLLRASQVTVFPSEFENIH